MSAQERDIHPEQLLKDFPAAISERQFKVFYQPKFDIRQDVPTLSSAEALVRWDHPTLGMISPVDFIPLFEENGLIQKLDFYVWEEAARQIGEWRERLDYTLPVSVNVSRVDMYDPHLVEKMEEILQKYALTPHDLLLEVTESVYTRDPAKIIEMAQKLRKAGFRIEMDDFGTGYSSLNMISTLPIDALKLDMSFVRDAFKEGGDTHILEIVIDIAAYLRVPVIAEGVETEEQLRTLRLLGCDIVQGYYFSKPVTAKDFEAFILQKKEADLAARQKAAEEQDASALQREAESARIVDRDLVAKLQQSEELPLEEPEEEKTKGRHVHLRTASITFIVVAFIVAIAMVVTDLFASSGYVTMAQAGEKYIEAQIAASEMQTASDYLTDRVRYFVITGNVLYLDEYFEEMNIVQTREKSVETIKRLFEGDDNGALASLDRALNLSNRLADIECYAMRLMYESGGYTGESFDARVFAVELSESDRSLSPDAMRAKALSLVYSSTYTGYKERIKEEVESCTTTLLHASREEFNAASARLRLVVWLHIATAVAFLAVVMGFVMMIVTMVRKPLTRMIPKMQDKDVVAPTGVEELRFVTKTYNHILHENRVANAKLTFMAFHDALTGLLNRGGHDLLIDNLEADEVALLIIDIDHFKEINDVYGHAIGDKVLKRVAETLRASFKSAYIISRLGGDEFAVLMTEVNDTMKTTLKNEVRRMSDTLHRSVDDLPPVTLSVGVAFAASKEEQESLYRNADAALYRVKQNGRNGCAFHE